MSKVFQDKLLVNIYCFFLYGIIFIFFGCSADNPDKYVTVKEPIVSNNEEEQVDINEGSSGNSQTGEPSSNFTTNKDLNDIYFVDNETGFIAGEGIVIKTTNGGESWQTVSEANLRFTSIFFEDKNIGILGGNDNFYSYAFITVNGGNTWEQVVRFWYQNDPLSVKGVHYDNNSGRMMILLNQRPNSSQNYGHIYVSNNNGLDFRRIGTDGIQGISSSVQFNNIIYTISKPFWSGSSYRIVQNELSFLKNSSENIISQKIDDNNNYLEILNPNSIFVNNSLSFITGDSGKFAISSDKGVNWTIRTIPNESNTALTSVSILNSDPIISTSNGKIYKSSDEGISWTEFMDFGNNSINKIFSLNNDILFVVGENGLLRQIQF